jgi:hypothetical protein
MKEVAREYLTTLQHGEIELRGEFLWGYNYTFLASIHHDGVTWPAVYKPTRGEQPLWDFPRASLARREVAAYLVSENLGWELVPPTVFRNDAPLGGGSLQLFIEHDPEYHYFNFSRDELQRLRATCLFDILINNADRKGSHILINPEGHLWLIDHGLCFHAEDKLRTVIWDFVGEAIPDDLVYDLERFIVQTNPPDGRSSDISLALKQQISNVEFETLVDRAHRLVDSRHFPAPDATRRSYPWPQI